MTTWKRWSWRYRLLALGALMMLLQGASCPLDVMQRPTYTVPIPHGELKVIGEVFVDESGKQYFLVETITPSGARGFRRVYANSIEYYFILLWFRAREVATNGGGDRSGIPGGAGTPPPPPVQ